MGKTRTFEVASHWGTFQITVPERWSNSSNVEILNCKSGKKTYLPLDVLKGILAEYIRERAMVELLVSDFDTLVNQILLVDLNRRR